MFKFSYLTYRLGQVDTTFPAHRIERAPYRVEQGREGCEADERPVGILHRFGSGWGA